MASTSQRPRSNRDIKPNKSNGTVFGDCSFGPVINLVMLQIEADEVRPLCTLGSCCGQPAAHHLSAACTLAATLHRFRAVPSPPALLVSAPAMQLDSMCSTW